MRLAVPIDLHSTGRRSTSMLAVTGGLGGVQQLLGCLGYETLTPSGFSHAKTKPGYVNCILPLLLLG